MMYFDAKDNVRISDAIGDAFDLLRGVRQGCSASPSFFTVVLAFISWTFCIIFCSIKLIHFYLSSFEYADDQILFILSASGLQEMLTFLADPALPFGLRLAPQKCELISSHRPATLDKSTLSVVKLGDHERYQVPRKASGTKEGIRHVP